METRQDEIPLHLYSNSLYRYLNDFIAPFYNSQHVYLNSSISTYEKDDNKATVNSGIEINRLRKKFPKMKFFVEIKENKIIRCQYNLRNKSLTAECID